MKFWKYGNALIGILLSAFACNAEPSAPPPVRIAYNYCTLSYTFAYYSDAEWDAEIDRLAKAGYNVALVTDGTFKVWQATLRELGVSEEEIAKFIPDETARAWWLMDNLYGEGGPLDQKTIDEDGARGRRICEKMRAKGIEPILQGFYGMWIDANPKTTNHQTTKLPNHLTIIPQGRWQCYTRPPMIDPTCPAFAKIAEVWYRNLEKVYGIKPKYLAGDLFHEGGKSKGVDVTAAARAVQGAQQAAFPGVTWVVQGWLSNPTPALLAGLDPEITLIEALVPQMNAFDKDEAVCNLQWGDFPWVWCEVLNFGGKHGLHGNLKTFARLGRAAKGKGAKTFRGYGSLSEGFFTNPVCYDLFHEMMMRPIGSEMTDAELAAWLDRWVDKRYGLSNSQPTTLNLQLREAWRLLAETVYDCPRDHGGPFEDLICAKPAWDVKRASSWGPKSGPWYDSAKLEKALELMKRGAFILWSNRSPWTEIDADVYDVERQVRADRFRSLLPKMKESPETRKEAEKIFASICGEDISDVPPEFRLSTYENRARARAGERGAKAWRRMITTWAGEKFGRTPLADYAMREYAELMRDYYIPRWREFLKKAETGHRASTLDLAGDGWRLEGKGEGNHGEIALPIRVPCDVQTALFDAGKLIDPSWGDNEKRAQWPGEQDWTYSREFDVPADFLENDSIILRLEDCDTFCTVKVNGEVAGVTSNRFMRYDFDVKRLLRPGRNTISGFFRSPEAVASELKKLYPDIPYGVANVKPNLTEGMPLIRKPACHGGWDWGLAQMVVGFCGKVELVGARASRVDYVYCDQDFAPDYSSVKVTVNVEAFAPKSGSVPFEVSLGGETKNETRALAAGMNKVKFEFAIAKPRLWWPVGQGEQNLYKLSVKTADGVISRRIGLRTAKLVNEKYIDPTSGEERLSFAFEINGRRIFAKGVNMIPTDAFDARQEEKYRPLLLAARECNMNMVRVWGGGQFERDSFYALCDELGLMVFHDLMFGCSRNPVDPWYMALVEAETRHQVKRLRDSPSIVLWAGDNECIGTALGGHVDAGPKKDRERRVAHWVDCWKKRTAEQSKWMKELDPSRVFWPSSPCDGFDDPCKVYNKPRNGDWHTYSEGAWLGARPNFCSEYGFQSYPSKDVALSFVKPEDVDPAKPLFAYHQKSEYGNGMLTAAIGKYYRKPKGGLSGENLIYISLNNQARLLRRGSEAWRVQMPYCMGELIWQLNDNWPVASWSLVEFGGKWKPAMYEARRFFAPVAAFVTSPKKGVITLTAVNDGPKAVGVKVKLRLMTFDCKTLTTETFDAKVEPCKAVLLKEYSEEVFGTEWSRRGRFLVVDVEADDPSVKTWQSGWFFDDPKTLNMEKPDIKMEVKDDGGKWLVTLSTDKPVFGVWVNATGVAGEFSDNHIALLPGEPRALEFKPREATTSFEDFRKSLSVKHLRATY